jgi:hypothetical protein
MCGLSVARGGHFGHQTMSTATVNSSGTPNSAIKPARASRRSSTASSRVAPSPFALTLGRSCACAHQTALPFRSHRGRYNGIHQVVLGNRYGTAKPSTPVRFWAPPPAIVALKWQVRGHIRFVHDRPTVTAETPQEPLFWTHRGSKVCRRVGRGVPVARAAPLPLDQQTYRRDIDKYILPRFGAYKIGRLPADEIENRLNDEIEAGYAPSSVHRHYRTFRRMLQVAVEKERVVANPFEPVEPPRVPTREMVFLTLV